MKSTWQTAFAVGILLVTATSVAEGKGGDHGKGHGNGKGWENGKGPGKGPPWDRGHRNERSVGHPGQTGVTVRLWSPPGLGRPVVSFDDLVKTREKRREAHRAAVVLTLGPRLADGRVILELDRHARFEAHVDVLEVKARELETLEYLGRLSELRRKEEERHAANLKLLAAEGGAK